MKPFLSILASFLILLVAIVIQSCTKDTVEDLYGPPPCDTTYIQNYSFDTVYPSDYIMAYPGSWWEYNDGHIDSCYNWATVSIFSQTNSGNCVTLYEDKQILPRTSFGYISFESKVINNQKTTSIEPLLAHTPGLFFDYFKGVPATPGNTDSHDITHTKEVIELLDSLEVNGITYYDIIHVHEYHYTFYYHVWGGPFWTNDFYYARNIGMIKQYSTFVNNPTVDRTLNSHFIAPH